MQTNKTNILILGKTGVGKSSLLNYLFGDEIATVGAGRPQTGKGLFKFDPFRYHNLDIIIYDSWGLEADKVEGWKKLIEDELKKNMKKDVRDWFHTIIYCIDAKLSRIDSFEISEIITPLRNSGNRLIFALTKWDLASTNEKNKIKEKLTKEFPHNLKVEICSINSKEEKVDGSIIIKEPFGRDILLNRISKNFRASIIEKSCIKFKHDLDDACKKAYQTILNKYEEETGWGIFVIYGEDFKKKMSELIKNNYQNAFSSCYNQFCSNINQANNLADFIEESYVISRKAVHLQLVNEKLSTSDFDKWDTGIFGGFFDLLPNSGDRKNKYREFLREWCNNIDAQIKLFARDCIEEALFLPME